MRVLVTGSAGFIGSHLVDALLERGDAVFGMDRKTGMDLNDPNVCRWARDFDPAVVVHLAARCSTAGSLTDPVGTFRDTVASTVNLLDAFHDRPFLLTSSVKARDGMTPYGAAKRMAETWVREYAAAFGTTVVINRPGTVYGPRQEGSPESGWVAWFLKAQMERRDVIVYGDGGQVRDLLHVSDYVRLLLAQVDVPAAYAGWTWDVGGGPDNAVTVEQMADELRLEHVHADARYGDARTYVGENTVPGWEPTVHWRDSAIFAGRLAVTR